MSHAKSTCPRQSARLSQKRHDRRMADCLVPDSQPEQNEPLVVITPTTPGFKGSNNCFTKSNIGSHMDVRSINYKLVFTGKINKTINF